MPLILVTVGIVGIVGCIVRAVEGPGRRDATQLAIIQNLEFVHAAAIEFS